MCDKCFRRTAIILASITAGVAVPPEEERDNHPGDKIRWTPKVIDAMKAMIQKTTRYAEVDVPEGESLAEMTDNATIAEIDRDISGIMKELSAAEVIALGTLCEGIERHFGAFRKWALDEVTERASNGDEEATQLISSRMGDMVSGLVSQLISSMGQKPSRKPKRPVS